MPHIEMRGRKIRLADWLAFDATDLYRFHAAKAKRARDRRVISLAVFDSHGIGLHEAACHVLATARGTLSVVGRTRRVLSMAGRARAVYRANRTVSRICRQLIATAPAAQMASRYGR